MIRKLVQYSQKNLASKQIFNFSKVPSWATVDPRELSSKNQHQIQNLVQGKWKGTAKYQEVLDPLNGGVFIRAPETSIAESQEFIDSALQCPKSGVHNPFKKPERYLLWGDINFKIAEEMRKQEVQDFFSLLTQRVIPKSFGQTTGEVVVTRRFFENFTGDNVRFLTQGFQVAGDHLGQRSTGYRWPYGRVSVICPFNFPIEIPCLQLFGALMVGNKPTLKVDSKVSIVMEQFLRMCISLGMDPKEVDMINSYPGTMEHIIKNADYKLTQFTGSSNVAEHLAQLTRGKVKLEDAGFDWKLFGPDVKDVEYAAWQCDQDAYAASGQKCSAQSIAFLHTNWANSGLIEKMKQLAARRQLSDLTIGPILTWNNKKIQNHIDALLKIPGAKILFGGKQLTNHNIPECYGAFEPTAIYVPVEQIQNNFELVTTELFGPFQIVSEYNDSQLNLVLSYMEKMHHHLTAAIVSNDPIFLDHVVGNTVNGTTYQGLRARTTGAPQNHWFGPAGDSRGAGIGTPGAILHVWTNHREIISDFGPLPNGWTTPKAT